MTLGNKTVKQFGDPCPSSGVVGPIISEASLNRDTTNPTHVSTFRLNTYYPICMYPEKTHVLSSGSNQLQPGDTCVLVFFPLVKELTETGSEKYLEVLCLSMPGVLKHS